METVQNESRFDAEHGDILQRYGSQISSPPTEMDGLTVVPASAELDNGNFWRLLHSASRQNGLGDIHWGILYVINNSSVAAGYAMATDPPNHEIDGDDILGYFEGYSPEIAVERYRENQKHLQFLSLLAEGKTLVAKGQDPHVMTQQIAEHRTHFNTLRKQIRIQA